MSSQRHFPRRLSLRDRDQLLTLVTHFKSDIVAAAPARTGGAGLTARETEVLCLVAQGKNNSEVARALFISLNTVTRHMTNVFTKTGTTNRVEAAVYATRHGVL